MENRQENTALKPHKFLALIKTTIEVLLIIVLILFEELVWKILAIPIKNFISKLKFLEKIEVSIMQQDKYTVLFIFLLALGIAELMGIYSGLLFVQGAIVMAVSLYILKAIVAGFTFWIFSFAKEILITIDWFNTLYQLFLKFTNYLTSHEYYISIKTKAKKVKDYISSLKGKSNFKRKYEDIKKVFKEHPNEEPIKEDTSEGENTVKNKKRKKDKANSKEKDSTMKSEKNKTKKGDK